MIIVINTRSAARFDIISSAILNDIIWWSPGTVMTKFGSRMCKTTGIKTVNSRPEDEIWYLFTLCVSQACCMSRQYIDKTVNGITTRSDAKHHKRIYRGCITTPSQQLGISPCNVIDVLLWLQGKIAKRRDSRVYRSIIDEWDVITCPCSWYLHASGKRHPSNLPYICVIC